LMGLISPRSELVNLSLNGEHFGIFNEAKSQAKSHDLMPGFFFFKTHFTAFWSMFKKRQ